MGAAIAAPAVAQNTAPAGSGPASTAAPATPATGEADEVIVTGSRIPQPNLTSASPVTVVGALEVKQQGTTRVEDLLNSLPQVFASEGSSDANAASGIATVDLRDLGTSRTLVLVNGKRLGPGDAKDPVSDLNEIPESLIKRVEILTGGASSVYGSDGLAGVVNFILNKDFEGFQLDSQVSFYNHDNNADPAIIAALKARNFAYPTGDVYDGFQKTTTLTLGAGTDDGKGHVTAYFSYRRVDALTQGDRDFSACGLSGSLQDGNASGLVCGGSSTDAAGRVRVTQNVALAPGATPVYSPSGPSLTITPGGFEPYVRTRDQFNYNPYNFFQRPDERFSFGAFAHYEVSKAFDPYLEVMFMDDRTTAQIAPSGAFYGTDFFINCNNALLSLGQQQTLCGAKAGTAAQQSVYIGRRDVEGGPRVDDLRHTDYRVVIGAKGEVAKGITYDVYGQLKPVNPRRELLERLLACQA